MGFALKKLKNISEKFENLQACNCVNGVITLLETGIVRNNSTNMQWGYLQNCLRILWFQCSYSLCLSGQNWIFFFIKHVNLRFPWSKDSMYIVNLLDIEYRIRSYVSNLSHDLQYQGSNVSTILADHRAHSNIFSLPVYYSIVIVR